MRTRQLHIWAPVLALLLCACNTSDALTPKVDVGGGLHPSSPVTQADAQRMANNQEPQASARSFPPAPSYASGPQNSRQAQSRAMNEGIENAVPRSVQAAPPSETTAQTMARPDVGTAQPETSSGVESIRFLPIIGAPVQAVTPLSKELGASARSAGVSIKASADSSAAHILKGYLSAFEDGGKVTVVYVWDVLDGAGARLNRIQGQLSTPSRGGDDPWASIPPDMMQSIGQMTIKSYLEWRNSRV